MTTMTTQSWGPRALVAAAAGLVLATGFVPAALAPTRAHSAAAASYVQFTSLNLGGDTAPSWSSDGQYVFYSTRVSGFPYIYRKSSSAPMNQSGTRLTSWEIEEFSASVSGDDAYVVMAVRDTLGFTHLWRCPSTGGAPLTRMTLGPYADLHPNWWGSGPTQEIAFSTSRGGSGYQIATLKPNGLLLATDLTLVTGPGFEDFHPCFSSDGQRIVFSSNRAGTRQLFVVTRQGASWGAPVQLTSGGGDKTNPAYSPSGLTIAYERNSGGGTTLWMVDATGANPRQVADGSGSYDAEPSFSPVTSQMAFVSDRTGAGYIWLINDISTPAAITSWGRVKADYRR
jgi:Tol biopolymer transport system component